MLQGNMNKRDVY